MTASERPGVETPTAARLVVALVRGVRGLKGDLRVEILTDQPEQRFAVGNVLHREGDSRPLTIVAAQADSPGWFLRFEEIGHRSAAESLFQQYLEAAVDQIDVPPPGAFYWHDVIGTKVRDLRGNDLGQVADVYRAGGVDAYIIRGGTVEEFDLPAVGEFIPVFSPGVEIVVDADRLDLEPARPPRPPRPPRPRKGDARRAAAAAAAAETADAQALPAAAPEPDVPAGES